MKRVGCSLLLMLGLGFLIGLLLPVRFRPGTNR